MSSADEVLTELGRQFGYQGLRFDHSGRVTVRFASGRAFGFERVDDTLILLVAQPVQYGLSERLLDAFKRADVPPSSPAQRPPAWPVSVVLFTQCQPPALAALTRLSGAQLTAAKAQQALAFLDEWNPAPV